MFNSSYLQERKMQKRGQKELLTILKCLNYKKSSPQVPSCFIAMRLAVFHNVFAIVLLWARKDVEKLFEETVWYQVLVSLSSIWTARCTCDYYKNSFYPRTIAQWTNLPPEIIASTSPCSLRQSLCNLTYWFVLLLYSLL